MPAWFRTIGYAAFLACSWTWCIGMFLPMILLRDFGPWSFAVFAIPNCVGAAVMGVLFHRRGASERFLARHLPACRAFSRVTIAFQMWFLFVLGFASRGAIPWIAGGIAAGAALGTLVCGRRANGRLLASLVASAVSLGLLGFWVSRTHLPPVSSPPLLPWSHLAALAPVCVLGFALCPFLDLTFHAARQSAPGRDGTRAFLIGFLVFFPALIAGTFFYGRHLIDTGGGVPYPVWAGPIAAHIAMQLVITADLHTAGVLERPRRWWRIGAPFAGFVVPAVLAIPATVVLFFYGGFSSFELTYRLFMAFYGLVFPAYVYLCAWGPDGTAPRPTRRALITFAAAVALAAPCYWMGFIERDTPWLVPGVLIWILAKGVMPGGKTATTEAQRHREKA